MYTLTVSQKKRILLERQRREREGGSITQSSLAHWAAKEFSLKDVPSKAAMSRIVSNSAALLSTTDKEISKKRRNRPGVAQALERVMFNWVCEQQSRRVFLNGDMIRHKAQTLLKLSNERVAEDKRIDLKFSLGWLQKFKKRWNLRVFRSHGESGDADETAIAFAMPNLQGKISQYEAKDVFNADECGLFYRMAPTQTIALERVQGRKKAKDRITVLPCSNMDGSEKIELLFIGTAAKPRAFKKKSGSELGFHYVANKKAWMTSEIFFDWLRKFQMYISKTPNRKALLLIDNCSAHGTEGNLPMLPNIEVVFLPPNCTSKIQPMDAGIIAALKLRYKRMQMDYALDRIDLDAKDVYKVDLLTAMRWFKRAWQDLPPSVIYNCWRHTKLCSGELHGAADSDEARLREELQSVVMQLVPPGSRMDVGNLLNQSAEDDVVQCLDDSEMVNAVWDELEGRSGDVEEEQEGEQEEETVSLPPTKQQLQALAWTKQIAEEAGLVDEHFLGKMRAIQRLVREEARKNLQQSTIDTFFS